MAHQFKGFACGCCATCRLGADHFDRDDSSSLGVKWTVDSGTWAISDEKLVATGAGKLTFTTVHPSGDTGMQHVTTTLTTDEIVDSTFRIRLAVTDEDNYLFAEVRIDDGCGELQVGKVVSGTETFLGDAIPTYFSRGDTFSLSACWQPVEGEDGTLTGALYGSDEKSTGRAVSIVEVAATGDGVGLEVMTGNVTFDTFAFSDHKTDDQPTCPECTPPGCGIHSELFSTNLAGGGARADGTDIGCHFDDVAGDWTADGALATTAGSALALCLQPGVANRQNVGVYVGLGNDADRARIIFDYLDASNYHFAELRVNTAVTTNRVTMSIGKVTGGTATTLQTATFNQTSVTIPRDGEFKVCLLDGYVAAVFGSENMGAIYGAIRRTLTVHGGKYVGVGTGSITTGVGFTEFNFAERQTENGYWDSCGNCPGIVCNFAGDGGHVSDFWLVELEDQTSAANGDVCNCDEANRAYIMQPNTTCSWSNSTRQTLEECPGRLDYGTASHFYPAALQFVSSRRLRVQIGWWSPGGGFGGTFFHQFYAFADLPVGVDARDVVRLELTPDADMSAYSDYLCNHSAMRIFATAI